MVQPMVLSEACELYDEFFYDSCASEDWETVIIIRIIAGKRPWMEVRGSYGYDCDGNAESVIYDSPSWECEDKPGWYLLCDKCLPECLEGDVVWDYRS